MKPRRVALERSATAADAVRRVVAARFDEACELAPALRHCEPDGLHQFRIACKRLRYALERCEEVAPVFAATAPALARVQDALGETHDCDLLIDELPATMPKTRARLVEERSNAAKRSLRLWGDALVLVRESLRYCDPPTPCSAAAGSRA